MLETSRYIASRGTRFASIAIVFALTLSACGGSTTTAVESGASAQTFGQHTEAVASGAQIIGSTPGVSPFIQILTLHLSTLASLASAEFTIAPKPASASRAVHVTYTAAAMLARQYMADDTLLTLPVFGLYAGNTNPVAIRLNFQDGSNLVFTTRTLRLQTISIQQKSISTQPSLNSAPSDPRWALTSFT